MAKKTPEINATSTADIAFLLLIFFLVSTTMDVDSGLFRRLPPMAPENQAPPKYAKRNILEILVNRDDQLAVESKLIDISELKEKAKEFILNPQNKDNLPEKVSRDVPLFGKVEVSKGIISLQSDRGTSYKMYIAVQDELTAAYNEIRDMVAMKQWGKKYSEISEDQQEAVRQIVPTAISEAEPRNIASKKGGKK